MRTREKRCRFAVLLAALQCTFCLWKLCAAQKEFVYEHSILQDLSHDYLAVTAAFALHGSPSDHHTKFPRALSALFDSIPIKDLKLTLTRGRWRQDWYGSALLSSPALDLVCVF